MKKQYKTPSISVVECLAPDVLASSAGPYTFLSEGNGEWLEWGKIKNG